MVVARSVCEVLEGFREAVDALAAVDPVVLADGPSVVELLAALNRVEAVVCRQAAAFDASGLWELDRAQNSSIWVTTEARVARSQSRRRLALGRALRTMPQVEVAFLAGRLAEEHVEALAAAVNQSAAAATAVAACEELLIEWATTLQFHRFTSELREWLNEVDPGGSDKRAGKTLDGRHVNLSQSFEDTWALDGVLDPVGGEIVKTVLSGIERELEQRDQATAAEQEETGVVFADAIRSRPQRRADALVEMATRAATRPKHGRRPAPLITVLVGEPAFARTCQLASGTVLTPGSLVPYLTDALIERVVFDGPNRVLAVGRQRMFKGALRRAIQVRHRRCTHPRCDRPVEDCDVDHVIPYGKGGITSERNGRLRCRFHNRIVSVPPTKQRKRRKTTPVFDEQQAEDRQDPTAA